MASISFAAACAIQAPPSTSVHVLKLALTSKRARAGSSCVPACPAPFRTKTPATSMGSPRSIRVHFGSPPCQQPSSPSGPMSFLWCELLYARTVFGGSVTVTGPYTKAPPPAKPASHAHVYEPFVFEHCALGPHADVPYAAHSSSCVPPTLCTHMWMKKINVKIRGQPSLRD